MNPIRVIATIKEKSERNTPATMTSADCRHLRCGPGGDGGRCVWSHYHKYLLLRAGVQIGPQRRIHRHRQIKYAMQQLSNPFVGVVNMKLKWWVSKKRLKLIRQIKSIYLWFFFGIKRILAKKWRVCLRNYESWFLMSLLCDGDDDDDGGMAGWGFHIPARGRKDCYLNFYARFLAQKRSSDERKFRNLLTTHHIFKLCNRYCKIIGRFKFTDIS